MAITPVSLYYTTATSAPSPYANVQIPTTIDGTTTGTPLTADQRVLVYALAAELLEGALYQQAYAYLTGLNFAGQPTAVTDALGYVYGSASVDPAATNLGIPTTNVIAKYLAEFGTVEQEHGQFLIQALGNHNPYAALNVAFAFGLNTITATNSTGTVDVQVGQAIYGAELTGVSAYLGAIPFFSGISKTVQIAASIQGTEARHTAALAIALNVANNVTVGSSSAIETAPMYNEGASYGVGTQGHGIDVPLTPDQILNAGSGTTQIPGALNTPGNGALKPVSGPNGAAVGAANGTTTPTYNGFVFAVSPSPA